MKYYYIRRIYDGITCIEDISVTKMYLIEGTQRALLIDTGIGFRGLRETVEKLTKLPYDVVLTHGHGDHCGAAGEFEEVYICKEDKDLFYSNQGIKVRLDYSRSMCEKYCPPEALAGTDFSRGLPHKVKFLNDEEKFELGGRCVTVIKVPGHTGGTAALYDDRTRSMIIGDACNPSTYVFSDEATDIESYRQSVKKIISWLPQTDHLLVSHEYGEYDMEIPKDTPKNVLECCNRVLDGCDDAEVFERSNVLGNTQEIFSASKLNQELMRIDGIVGNIVYSKKKIRKTVI